MRYFLFLLPFVALLPLRAQTHVAPADGDLGIPGREAHSFLLFWSRADSAIGYEYVLSDNFVCTAGCAGDTREAFVADTFTVEYDLIEGKTYYWITRILYPNSASQWTLPSDFYTYTPEQKPLAKLAPSPAQASDLRILLDWTGAYQAGSLEMQLYDPQGRSQGLPIMIERPRQGQRFQTLTPEVAGLSPGLYFAVFQPRHQEGSTLRPFVQKVLITE
ncbi:MAG: hypothetical protein EAZ89_15675 [Bacteroidetes bacterium]|nr:MAG: hypothetical protein EAZ89_15675 [Bacteroidota bacterium]